MTLITMQGGSVVFRDGKVGTGQPCCCGSGQPTGACCTNCLPCRLCRYDEDCPNDSWILTNDLLLYGCGGDNEGECPLCPPAAEILQGVGPPSGLGGCTQNTYAFVTQEMCCSGVDLVCTDNKTQEECEAEYGVWHSGEACTDPPDGLCGNDFP